MCIRDSGNNIWHEREFPLAFETTSEFIGSGVFLSLVCRVLATNFKDLGSRDSKVKNCYNKGENIG